MGVTVGAIVGITGKFREGTGAGCGGGAGGGAIFATGVTVTVADLLPLPPCLFAEGADAADVDFPATTAVLAPPVAPRFFEELLVFTFAPTAGTACARFPDGRFDIV
jgi:hypothetical protein